MHCKECSLSRWNHMDGYLTREREREKEISIFTATKIMLIGFWNLRVLKVLLKLTENSNKQW